MTLFKFLILHLVFADALRIKRSESDVRVDDNVVKKNITLVADKLLKSNLSAPSHDQTGHEAQDPISPQLPTHLRNLPVTSNVISDTPFTTSAPTYNSQKYPLPNYSQYYSPSPKPYFLAASTTFAPTVPIYHDSSFGPQTPSTTKVPVKSLPPRNIHVTTLSPINGYSPSPAYYSPSGFPSGLNYSPTHHPNYETYLQPTAPIKPYKQPALTFLDEAPISEAIEIKHRSFTPRPRSQEPDPEEIEEVAPEAESNESAQTELLTIGLQSEPSPQNNTLTLPEDVEQAYDSDLDSAIAIENNDIIIEGGRDSEHLQAPLDREDEKVQAVIEGSVKSIESINEESHAIEDVTESYFDEEVSDISNVELVDFRENEIIPIEIEVEQVVLKPESKLSQQELKIEMELNRKNSEIFSDPSLHYESHPDVPRSPDGLNIDDIPSLPDNSPPSLPISSFLPETESNVNKQNVQLPSLRPIRIKIPKKAPEPAAERENELTAQNENIPIVNIATNDETQNRPNLPFPQVTREALSFPQQGLAKVPETTTVVYALPVQTNPLLRQQNEPLISLPFQSSTEIPSGLTAEEDPLSSRQPVPSNFVSPTVRPVSVETTKSASVNTRLPIISPLEPEFIDFSQRTNLPVQQQVHREDLSKPENLASNLIHVNDKSAVSSPFSPPVQPHFQPILRDPSDYLFQPKQRFTPNSFTITGLSARPQSFPTSGFVNISPNAQNQNNNQGLHQPETSSLFGGSVLIPSKNQNNPFTFQTSFLEEPITSFGKPPPSAVEPKEIFRESSASFAKPPEIPRQPKAFQEIHSVENIIQQPVPTKEPTLFQLINQETADRPARKKITEVSQLHHDSKESALQKLVSIAGKDWDSSLHTGKNILSGNSDSSTSNFQCPSLTGDFPHPESCSVYFQCAGGVAHKRHCQDGLNWNMVTGMCDWEQNVDCEINKGNKKVTASQAKVPVAVNQPFTVFSL